MAKKQRIMCDAGSIVSNFVCIRHKGHKGPHCCHGIVLNGLKWSMKWTGDMKEIKKSWDIKEFKTVK